MCGSIAVSQATSRIIGERRGDKNLRKVVSCIAWEYYLGKGITYSLLACFMIAVGSAFKSSSILKIVRGPLLFFVLFYFVLSSVKTAYGLFNKRLSFPKIFNSNYKPKFLKMASEGVLIRLCIGLSLGLIPCGMVYGALVTIASNTDRIPVGMAAALAFGVGTFPGLFALAYSGNLIFYRFKKLFDLCYLTSLIWNIKVLFSVL